MISTRLQSRELLTLHEAIGLIGLIIMTITSLAFCLAIFWVDYTCAHVIATLAAVEDPNPPIYIQLESEEPFSHDATDPEAAAPEAQPTTSSLRSSIKHLRSHGIWSKSRGFPLYIVLGVLNLFMPVIPLSSFIPINVRILAFLKKAVVAMATATLQMAWVHLVIARKGAASPHRRRLGLRHWPQIAPAAALNNLIEIVTFSVFRVSTKPVGWTIGWTLLTVLTNPQHGMSVGDLVGDIVAALIFPLIFAPVRAIFVRVAASLLPEEDDPIVTFDRSFGGKVKPGNLGSGRLGLVEAWTTFEWPARRRFLLIVIQAFGIEVALVLVGILVVWCELWIIIGLNE